MKRRNRRGLHSAGPEKYGFRTVRIFTGIAKGISQKQMARDLNDAAIPTKRGGRWSQSLISNIVNDPFYAGFVRAGDELVKGKHEAIVDMELVEQAKAMWRGGTSAAMPRVAERRSGRRCSPTATCAAASAGRVWASETSSGSTTARSTPTRSTSAGAGSGTFARAR